MAEGKRQLRFHADVEKNVVTVKESGENGKEILSVKLSEIPKELHAQITLFGIQSKLSNASAKGTGEEGGMEERIESMRVVVANMKAGQWRAESEAGERVGKTVLVMEHAFNHDGEGKTLWAKIGKGKPATRDAVRELIAAMGADKSRTLRTTPMYLRSSAALANEAAKSAKGSVAELFA